MTRLQGFLVALKDLRLDALDELADREFAVFVSIACDVFGHDAARVYLARWLQDRIDEEHAA